MDWNNINFLPMEESGEGGANYFVHPHQPGAVAVMSDEVVIPIEQSSNVVFRTLEGLNAGGEGGVEVIGFLDEGQQMHLVEGMDTLPVNITEEEIFAQLQAQAQLQQHQQPTMLSTVEGNNVVVEGGGIDVVEGGHQQVIGTENSEHVVIVENLEQGQQQQTISPTVEESSHHALLVESSQSSVPVSFDTQNGSSQEVVTEEANILEHTLNISSAPPNLDELSTKAEVYQHDVNDSIGVIPSTIANTSTSTPDVSPAVSSELEPAKEVDKEKELVTAGASVIFEGTTSASAPEQFPSTTVGESSQKDSKTVNERMDVSITEEAKTFKIPKSSPSTVKSATAGSSSSASKLKASPSKPSVRVFETVPESPREEPIIIEITDDDEENDDDDGLLNDVPEPDDDVICISSDEEDEGYKIQMQNARTMERVKQSVDDTAATYRPRYVSRERLNRKHPRFRGLTYKEIMHQAILEDKILPDFNEQVIPRKIADKVRVLGDSLHRAPDGGFIISSKKRSVKMYYSSFSARFEPVLADPTLENYVQEYRKTLDATMWKKRVFGRKEVDPSSVIPASIGSTGSSSIGSETDPECLATDEEESESELMQGSVAAWIIPDAIVSRTPSPEPDFDEPQFITTPVGSHTIVEGPPTKKRKQKHHEPKPHTDGKIYPKPAFSYSCLIAMALKNSKTGSLPVSEIYKFMCDHFPYFKSAPSGWKNSVRHNLSLNKCFEKIEKPGNNGARKGCLWALNPAKIHKMDEEVQKWSRKDPLAIRRAMSDPENLELIEKGELKRDYSGAGASDDDEDEDFSEPATPLTPAQVQARRSRTNSSDSTLEGTTAVVTPVVTTVSQVHAALQRSLENKSQIQVKREDAVEIGTITNIQGNYVCHTPNGNGTYTLSFANIGSSSPLTPIIIRRTPTVK